MTEKAMGRSEKMKLWYRGFKIDANGRFMSAKDGSVLPPLSYSTPLELIEECVKYFEWLEENPHYEARLTTYEGISQVEKVPRKRVATVGGLCLFLGICEQTLQNLKADPRYKTIIDWACRLIYEDKFNSAAAGLLNANFIARDLGLAEKVDNTSSDGSMTPSLDVSKLTPEVMEAILAAKNTED